MGHTPDNSPNFSASPSITVEALDHFVAGREHYKQTDDPIATLRYAYMDEALELMNAIPKDSHDHEYDHDNLVEEIGDATIMGVLIARNQDIPLTDLLGRTDLSAFQQRLDPGVEYNWQNYGIAVMRLYENIDQSWHRSPDQPDTTSSLSDFFAQIAGVATAHSIDFSDAVQVTMTKLETRTRKNHSVEAADKPNMPVTHAGRLILKHGLMPREEIVVAERQ